MRYLRILLEEVRVKLLETISYKVDFIGQIVIISCMYIMIMFFNAQENMRSYYNVGKDMSSTMILIGYIFWTFSMNVLNSIGTEIEKEAVKGTLEQKFMSILPYEVLIIGDFIASILTHIIVVAVLILISKILFNIKVLIDIVSIIYLLICLVGMYGMSLCLGAMSLYGKKISNVYLIIQLFLLTVCNIVYKEADFYGINRIIPLTNAIDSIRKYYVSGIFYTNEFKYLVISSFAWLLFGIIIFNISDKRTKIKGYLSCY